MKPPRMNRMKRQLLVNTLLVIAIVVVANYLGARTRARWDMTGTRFYSLSPKSTKVLQELEQDVYAHYFYKDNPTTEAGDILVEFGAQGERFRLAEYDLDKHPEVAQRYGVKNYDVLVLQYEDRFKRLVAPDEPSITNAIVRLVKGNRKLALFTVGHGEHSLHDFERTGCSSLETMVKLDNMRVDTIMLATTEKIPDSCNVLVVNGSEKKWTRHEIGLVRTYLKNGGSVFLNVDESKPGLDRIVRGWGIALGKAVVVDLTASLFGASPGITTVLGYGYHDITEDFRLMTAFELPRQIKVEESLPKHLRRAEFLVSGPQSWGETGDIHEDLEYDEGKDLEGPLTFGVALEDLSTRARLVVIGDSEYPTNAYLDFAGNSDLYLNTLSWLTKQEDMISIRKRELSYQRLDVTETQASLFFALALFLMPVTIVGAGIVVWVRRRR